MVYDERLKRLRAKMAETKTDVVVLGPSSHMVWLSGLSPHGDERPVLLVVTQNHAGFLMPALNAESSKKVTGLPLYSWADAEGAESALVALLDDAGASGSGLHVALDETMRADFALLALKLLPGAKHSFSGATLGVLRAQKDPGEYQTLKANALLNDGAMRAAFAALKPGVTEKEIAGIISNYYAAHGARTEFISVCFGGNGAFPHHTITDRQLQKDDAILIDTGGRSQGYPSDMTRVGTIGKGVDGFDAIHAIVEKAVAAALAAARPGVPAKMVDKAARDVIAAAGYGDTFVHRTGHGLGLDIHEEPYITATSDKPLEEGNVFSIEPGIYLKDRFGIRLEEIVIIRNGKAEILSDLPRQAFRVGG